MCTVVNDTVHVEIEAVELWNAILSDELRDGRIPLREPSEELGDTHDSECVCSSSSSSSNIAGAMKFGETLSR